MYGLRLQREHQEQKLAGKFIDLDAVPLGKIQEAQQAIKKEEEKEERKKVKEEQDKKKKAQNLLQDAVVSLLFQGSKTLWSLVMSQS